MRNPKAEHSLITQNFQTLYLFFLNLRFNSAVIQLFGIFLSNTYLLKLVKKTIYSLRTN